MPIEDYKSNNETPKKKFYYSSGNDDYLHTIPSASTISDCKQMQTSQAEINAALALLNKNPDARCTLH